MDVISTPRLMSTIVRMFTATRHLRCWTLPNLSCSSQAASRRRRILGPKNVQAVQHWSSGPSCTTTSLTLAVATFWPRYILRTLVSSTKSILPTGGDHVFGLKFTQALVEQVKTMKALNQVGGIRRNSGSSNSSSGKNGHRSSSSQHGSKTNKGHSLPEISSNKTQNPVWDKLLALHQSGPNLRLTHGSCPP